MGMLDVCSSLHFNNDLGNHIDFVGKGNIWINNTYDDSVIQLARQIISDAIFQTYPGQISVLGYDADLSGVFAPFSSLSTGENKTIELIYDGQSFKTQLKYIQQQITSVQNVIQGRTENLIQFRQKLNRPVEGYKLVVLVTDMGLIDQDVLVQLSLLLRNGPACGISFLIISTTYISRQTSDGKEIELKIESLAPNITVLESSAKFISLNGRKMPYEPISVESIISQCTDYLTLLRNTSLPVVSFSDIQNIKMLWNSNSTDGITFSIGKYGTENMEITIGDEINQRHNAIITGAVGQGKSNLISVIIHSMCMRYSPQELQLYLLDFKEGVTFKVFSNIGHEEYLPHAKALGLESDVSFGLAVMDSLFKTYQRRMHILKDHNVKSIRDFRKLYPQEEMPRIVVIIDEFQMMFGDDLHKGQEIANVLEKSVRLFRAAGIHFILASQALLGNMALSNKSESLFSQVPIRIALKNSISESQQVLTINNSAAAFLHPREAIVNLDYGEISQNRKTVIAFADENLLFSLRQKMWEKARNICRAPYVFESERRVTICNAIDTINQLREQCKTPTAIVGNKISVDDEKILLPLPNEAGRNIAIIGTPDLECDQATGILQSIAVSLALQHPRGDARFLFCDFRNNDASYSTHYPQFAKLMENTGFFIEYIARKEFEQIIKQMLEEETVSDTIYLFAAALDRWECSKDAFGQGTVLKEYVENGPSKNKHFIGWWSKPSSFSSQVAPYGTTDAFNSKIFLRIDERSVQSLTSPLVRWTSQSNRALVSDNIEFSEEITFIPFSPITTDDINKINAKVWT